MDSYWRIYCITESLWSYGYLASTPTVCFNNNTHTVNSGSTQELQEASSTISAAQTVISSTIDSTSIGTGALVIDGGISVAGISYTSSINSSGTLYTTGNLISSNPSGSQVVIDCQNSQSPGGSLLFTGVSGFGDYSIGSGVDGFWIGGGGRAMQLGSYSQVIIKGGNTLLTAIPQISGNGATYNCQIINTNDSIGLTVQGGTSQSADLTQWTNSSGTVLAKVTSSGIIISLGSFTYPYGGVYGLGGLGNVTISGNTTLSANSYYNNLTINSGVTLNPGGFQIFVANTLTFVSATSTIACNGGNASGVTGGTAASTYADLVSGTYSTYLGGATAGANGRTTTGIGNASTGYTTSNASVAGSGANGGNSSGNVGGTAGLVTAITAKDGSSTLMDTLPNALGRGNVSSKYIAFNGGTGGASGGLTAGTGTTLVSGAGGGGGGVVVLAARIIVAASGGVIQAIGGNGSNATAGTLGTASIGGGGSGGGGIVSIITSTPWSSLGLSVSVAAGTPGTGLGTGGLSGSTGSVGRIIINQI